jgi:hypothetical protein
MRNYLFSIRKRAIFRHGQEIEELRGGVHRYAAQASPKIDAAMAEKGRFRMKTIYTETLRSYEPIACQPQKNIKVIFLTLMSIQSIIRL